MYDAFRHKCLLGSLLCTIKLIEKYLVVVIVPLHNCIVGAFDGVTGSNTLMFERDLGWKGILIEGNPDVNMVSTLYTMASILEVH